MTANGQEMRRQCQVVHELSERVVKERNRAFGLEIAQADRDRALNWRLLYI